MKLTRRRVVSLRAGAAAALGVPSLWMSRMKTYDGPVSDHFDGLHFFDPDGVPPKQPLDILRWQFGRDRQRHQWPEWAPSPSSAAPRQRATGRRVRRSSGGRASWLIQTSGLNILVDPVWSM